jgi:hypothetical protein
VGRRRRRHCEPGRGRGSDAADSAPLIGFDKEEITSEAQRLGTYETSIIPDDDCCTLFTPRYPTTRASRDVVDAAEAELDVTALVDEAVRAAVLEDFSFPVLRLAARTHP